MSVYNYIQESVWFMENRFPLFPPKVLYVSNITQDALLSVQNKSLLFYTHYFSNEWCDVFALSVAKKKSNRRNSTPPTKSAIKKRCYKMTWSNSPIKHQIIKLFTITIPNTLRQLNSWGSWIGRWTFTSILVHECASQLEMWKLQNKPTLSSTSGHCWEPLKTYYPF